ncbi:MAG: LCP family protein [Bacilli bacterium]|nr:LCP family protein [Bacilli bacterium]
MKRPVLSIALLSALIINTIIFQVQFNNLVFANKIIPILINSLLFIILIGSLYIIYKLIWKDVRFKKSMIIVSILLNIFLLIINFSTNIFDKMMSKITSDEVIYTSTIIVRNDSSINSIDDLNNKKIGISDNESDYENNVLAYEYLSKNNKVDNNTFYKYNDYLLALNDLLNGNIDALIISNDYQSIYSEYFNSLSDSFKRIINPLSKSIKKVKDIKHDLNDSFTVLIIGADGQGGSTYNADVLILMTINPNTKNVVMVDVVRDTYAYNLGNSKMDKITHSGWYGNENVVATVANLFDINIDYYIKFNFQSVVELVDLIGGVNINVPYKYPVKMNGKNYYIQPGQRTLNGLETLALARTRKEIGSSLFTRGEMQMTIIEEVIKQTDGMFLLKNFFKFSSILENNIKTNIKKEDLYYYIQKYISIKGDLTFSHNRLMGADSSYYHTGMKSNLYTYIPNVDSLNQLKALLKNNL